MKTHSKTPQARGFALVVTLSLMILLTIIAVGLLTLSTVSLRSAGQGNAISTARNNARLAMMLALGELQTTLGPDQGVSAPAAAVVKDAKRPHLLGAWQSWHWTPTPGGTPPYSEKKNRFRGWLVSTATPSAADQLSLAAGNEPTGANAVNLVGDPAKPLTDSQDNLVLVMGEKIKVGTKAQPGKLAWAVFDESTKAAVDLGDPTSAPVAGLEIASRTAPNRFRADVLDAKLASLKTPEKLISLETATVPAGQANVSEFRRRFHDFSTGAIGLLTDTANGGLKTDLTSLFEPTSLPAGAFVAPTKDSPYDTSAFPLASGAPKWAYIRDHYRKYKTVKTANSEATYAPSSASDLKVKNAGTKTGVEPAPDTERLIPVIAKLQLVFSMIAHEPVPGRRAFYTQNGFPKGAYTGNPQVFNYGVFLLACDPVITLYNPYDVTLNLQKTRIRIWDPPVVLRFRKYDNGAQGAPARPPAYFRANGDFATLGQLQSAYATNPNARKCFTLVLADGVPNAIANSLKLKPGEVKVFSPRVESSWCWKVENDEVWNTSTKNATFFDWNVDRNFGNVDNRGTAKFGQFGLECIPRWDQRAGLQVDHLADPRDPGSKYAFESNTGDKFVTLRNTDEVEMEIKPQVASANAVTQFQVDVLAGVNRANNSGRNVMTDTQNTEEVADTLRSYRFNFTGMQPSDELSEDPSNPVIKRNYTISGLMQSDSDKTKGNKKPIAMLEMSSRTTKDTLTDSKPWLYNNFVVEGGVQNTSTVGLTHQSYDLRLMEMTSFDSFPGGIEIDPDTYRGYHGASGSVQDGSSFVNMLHIPLAPSASLGDLIPTNLASGSLLPRVVHPFGNSRAHPLVPSRSVSTGTGAAMMMDHSYLLNDALWDSYYFSSIAAYGGSTGGVMPVSKPLKSVLAGMFDGTEPALNSRLVPATIPGDPDELADKVANLKDLDRSKQLAKYVAVNGSFNVNSTSVDAWRAVLSALRDRTVNGMELTGATGATVAQKAYGNSDLTPFVRTGKPLADSAPPSGLLWAGYRALTDPQIKKLARMIVTEITARGVEDSAPCLSLGEFVNRRPGGASDLHSLAGLLQTAIDKADVVPDEPGEAKINDTFKTRDSKTLSASSISAKRKQGVMTEEALDGFSAEGAPSMLTQGDLMAALAPIATVRGDTFKIRSYGEAVAADGTTILARAWCEAVVQRLPDFVDPADAPETVLTSLSSNTNKIFGRRFNIVSFRWLSEKEI